MYNFSCDLDIHILILPFVFNKYKEMLIKYFREFNQLKLVVFSFVYLHMYGKINVLHYLHLYHFKIHH